MEEDLLLVCIMDDYVQQCYKADTKCSKDPGGLPVTHSVHTSFFVKVIFARSLVLVFGKPTWCLIRGFWRPWACSVFLAAAHRLPSSPRGSCSCPGSQHTAQYPKLFRNRSEGRPSRGISSPGGGADQDQVFPCRVVLSCCRVVVGSKKSKNLQISARAAHRRPEIGKNRQKSKISRMTQNDSK